MISVELIQQAKQVPIEAYLAYRGFMPVSSSGHRLLYRSPLRAEKTPSFWVNLQLNRYKDFGSCESEKGDDVIRLVQQLDRCTFENALLELHRFSSQFPKISFFLSGPSQTPAKANAIQAVKLLQNPHLVRYVESRRISYAIARKYCQEVYYTQGDKNLFAVGFRNEQGGYVLRNGIGVKRNIGPTYYTFIAGQQATSVNVFEGVFDFLSALEYYGLTVPNCPTLVLNSTTNLEAALPALKGYSKVNAYFDHDKAGRAALDKLQSIGICVTDRSSFYQGYNDLNEFWQCLSVYSATRR